MVTVGITQLRRHFGQYMAKVKAGEDILITQRGIPVARILPITEAEREEIERKLSRERENPL